MVVSGLWRRVASNFDLKTFLSCWANTASVRVSRICCPFPMLMYCVELYQSTRDPLLKDAVPGLIVGVMEEPFTIILEQRWQPFSLLQHQAESLSHVNAAHLEAMEARVSNWCAWFGDIWQWPWFKVSIKVLLFQDERNYKSFLDLDFFLHRIAS